MLGKINAYQVLRAVQEQGPISRAEIARLSGISAPTVSRAAEALLKAGLLEERDDRSLLPGRPAKRLQLARDTAQALGLVIDAGECRLVTSGLDGKITEGKFVHFATPENYPDFLEMAVAGAKELMDRPGVKTLGMGITLPGLLDLRRNIGVLSPNVPMTNGQSPAHDLTERLGIECVQAQEDRALCLGEYRYGAAQGLDNFAMLDVSTGVGLSVMSGGKLLSGHSGLAGEIGHITIEPEGRLCGCGNRGCLETLSSDTSFAHRVSQKIGRKVTFGEALALIENGGYSAEAEVQDTLKYLAIVVAAVINLFNPSNLFVHGNLFKIDDSLFPQMIEETGRRALTPSFADCRIVQAQGNKRQGALAAIIEHLAEGIAPDHPAADHIRPGGRSR